MDKFSHEPEAALTVPGWPAEIDPETAYIEAVAAMEGRERGHPGTWSHPAIYRAAVEIGAFDLKSRSYEEMRIRWQCALARAFLEPMPIDIPPPVAVRANASEEWKPPSPDNASKKIALMKIKACLSHGAGRRAPKRWMRPIREKLRSGEGAVPASVAAAVKAKKD